MQQYRKNLGKVSLTAEGAWNGSKAFDILSIVYDEHTQHGFISRQAVPKGVDLYNKKYWMPFNVSGYADNNVIILSKKTAEHAIQSYTLEEAIASIKSVGRRPGAILGFYNENADRLDIGGRWELWQFNDTNVYNWDNVDSWQNLYYNYNKFMGWFKDENFLNKYAPFPEIGCYAFVGSEFNEATVYRCDNKYVWNNTTQHAWDYVKVVVDGNVTVGENGNWFNNEEDTGIPASVKGENGKTPIFREKDNTIQYSFDNVNWITISDKVAAWFRWNATISDTQANNVGRIQISRDGVTWTNLSGDIINNLHISRYIGADESLPTSGIAEGTIYAKGPSYDENDASHANPIYRLWVYAWKGNTLAWQDNGEFTSIAAGVVQETGDSETEVMSQKAVTEKLSELASKVSMYECETLGQIAEKIIEDEEFVLLKGKTFKVKFFRANAKDDVTLKIGTTEAKPLFYNGSQASSNNYWNVGEILDVYYDGEVYQSWSTERVSDVRTGGNKVLAAEVAKTLDNKLLLSEKYYGQIDLVEIPFLLYSNVDTRNEYLNIIDGAIEVINNNLCKCTISECVEGDNYILDGRGGTSNRLLWAFADKDYKIIARSELNITVNNLLLEAPVGSAYLIVNIYTDLDKGHLYKGTPLYAQSNPKDFKYDLSIENFDFGIRCIHHDNFFRNKKTNLWNIGSNTNYNIMLYFSLREDYTTVDDGFRLDTKYDANIPNKIISGRLTNDKSITTGINKAFRFLSCSNSLADSFYIEVSCPSVNHCSEVVFNFKDESNYESFEIVNENGIKINKKKYQYGILSISEITNLQIKCSSIKIAYSEGQVRLYVDDSDIYYQLADGAKKVLNNLQIDKKMYLGISVSTEYDYEYRTIAVYNIVSKQHSESNRAYINYGIPYNMILTKTYDYQYEFGKTLRICGVGNTLPLNVKEFNYNARYINLTDNNIYSATFTDWVKTGESIVDYQMYFDVYNNKTYVSIDNSIELVSEIYQDFMPNFVQKFEVRASDVTGNASARVEVIENFKNDLNYSNLIKRHISFKSFLPSTYLNDDKENEGEVFIQFQSSTEGGQTRGPLFAIAADVVGVDNKTVRYHTNRRNIPTRPVAIDIGFPESVLGEDNIDLGEAKLGVWESWDIYFKEGYMKEHCPLCVIKRNGVEVYRNVLPNCQNITFGSYIRYGIYKSSYVNAENKDRKRILYIADFEYTT